jgi:hypothetical protein
VRDHHRRIRVHAHKVPGKHEYKGRLSIRGHWKGHGACRARTRWFANRGWALLLLCARSRSQPVSLSRESRSDGPDRRYWRHEGADEVTDVGLGLARHSAARVWGRDADR